MKQNLFYGLWADANLIYTFSRFMNVVCYLISQGGVGVGPFPELHMGVEPMSFSLRPFVSLTAPPPPSPYFQKPNKKCFKANCFY